MKRTVTEFEIGLIRKLHQRGKMIEKEVINAILGGKLWKEDLSPQDKEGFKARILEHLPVSIYNYIVGQPNGLAVIKQEPL